MSLFVLFLNFLSRGESAPYSANPAVAAYAANNAAVRRNSDICFSYLNLADFDVIHNENPLFVMIFCFPAKFLLRAQYNIATYTGSCKMLPSTITLYPSLYTMSI
jgi:hypothetical protein